MTAVTTAPVRALTDGTQTLYRLPFAVHWGTEVQVDGASVTHLGSYGSKCSWWRADGEPQAVTVSTDGEPPTVFHVADMDAARAEDRKSIINQIVAREPGPSTCERCGEEFKLAADRRDRQARTPDAMVVNHEPPSRTYYETITGKVDLVEASEITVEHIGRCEPHGIIYQFVRTSPDSRWGGTITVMAKTESSFLPDAFGPGSVIDPPQWLVDVLAGIVPAEGLTRDPMEFPADRVSPPFQKKPVRRSRRR